MPTVSLVVATYNRGPRIATTLDAVLAQTRPPDELVVVDDCSPDGTGDWVRSNYPTARVVRPPANGGTSAARNFGAAHAAGEVLVFLDHDDELHPHAVRTLLDLLGAFPEARAAFADHRYEDRVSGTTYPDHHTAQAPFRRMRAIPTVRTGPLGRVYGYPMYRALLRGNLLQQPWAVYRDDFRAAGGFSPDVRYCEDWDLYLRVCRRFPVAVSDAVISTHVVEGENLHLTPNQTPMYLRVLGRRLRQDALRDPAAAAVAARRMATYHKTDGDRAYPHSWRAAWLAYCRAFALWPFDPVVVAGAVFGFAPWILTGRPRKVPE